MIIFIIYWTSKIHFYVDTSFLRLKGEFEKPDEKISTHI